MKHRRGFVVLIRQWSLIAFQLGKWKKTRPSLGHEALTKETPQQAQFYERVKSQLYFGSVGELLTIHTEAFENRDLRLRLGLLKLSALMQSGNFVETRALAHSLLMQGCGKEQLARHLMSATIFTQAEISFRMGDELQAVRYYAEGLRVLQHGIDEQLMAQAWLSRMKSSELKEVTCV